MSGSRTFNARRRMEENAGGFSFDAGCAPVIDFAPALGILCTRKCCVGYSARPEVHPEQQIRFRMYRK